MQSSATDPKILAGLDNEINEVFKDDNKVEERHRTAKRIQLTIRGISRKLGVEGEVKMFGSWANGLKTGSSDLDIVFVCQISPDTTVPVLGRFSAMVADLGFENVTKIFQANVPLVKFTDTKSQMEVDFCINNVLGVRNSLLLWTYCEVDLRVGKLGRLVKNWAKRHELVGTADGCLNSYAYMLLVIHFLQTCNPPVLPNLQALATKSVRIADHKWGTEDYWETKFVEDVASLPPTQNKQSLGELLLGFFNFFSHVFDWRAHAVCMRLNQQGQAVDKYSLATPTNDEQWYVEDPFDLKHNLAGKCTRGGRKRIMDEMREAHRFLTTTHPSSGPNGPPSGWTLACPPGEAELFYLKCRISPAVTPQAMLEEFEAYNLIKLYFPKPDGSGRMGQAFLEFGTSAGRRRAHTKNETYVADCQLGLHQSSQYSLAEIIHQGNFSTYDMASYKMQRQILAARANLPVATPQRPDTGRGPIHEPTAIPGPVPMIPMPGGQNSVPPGADPRQFPGFAYRPSGPPPTDVGMMGMQGPGQPPLPQGSPGNHWDSQAPSFIMPKHQQAKAAMAAQRKAQAEAPAAKHVAQAFRDGKAMGNDAKAPMAAPKAAQKAAQMAARERGDHSATTVLQAKAKMAAKGGASVPGMGREVGAGNWVDLRISNDLPSNHGPLLTKQQEGSMKELQTFLHKFKSDSGKAKEHIVVQVDLSVKDDARGKLSLSSDQWKALHQLKNWCKDKPRAQ